MFGAITRMVSSIQLFDHKILMNSITCQDSKLIEDIFLLLSEDEIENTVCTYRTITCI